MDIQQVVKQSRPASMTTLDTLGLLLTRMIRFRTVICYASYVNANDRLIDPSRPGQERS